MFMSAGCPKATEAVLHRCMPCTPQPERSGYAVGYCIPIRLRTSRFGVIRTDYDTRASRRPGASRLPLAAVEMFFVADEAARWVMGPMGPR